MATQLNELFSWRLAMMLGMTLIAPLLGQVLLPTKAVVHLAIFLVPAVQLVFMTDFLCWIFKGALRPGRCAFLQIASPALLLLLCMAAVRSPRPFHWITGAYIVAALSSAALGLNSVSRSLQRMRLVKPRGEFFSTTLPDIYKIGGILILSMALTRLDVLLVAHYGGDVQAGLFGSVGRMMDGLRLIPTAAYSVFLPFFASSQGQLDVLRNKFKMAFLLLFALAVFISLGAYSYSEPLIIFILGMPYAESVAYFKPLVWSNLFVFTNILMFAVLYALNDHQTPAVAIGTGLLVELGLDVFLLPRYGTMAAVGARLVSECMIFMIFAVEILRRRLLGGADLFVKPVVLTGSCLFALYALRGLPGYLHLPACLGVFVGLTWLLYPIRNVIDREWRLLKNDFS